MMTKRQTLACWPAPWLRPPCLQPAPRHLPPPGPASPSAGGAVPSGRRHGRHCAHAGREGWQDAGQPFVIENKPGAGGNIGADFVAKQPGDGYTLMITSIGMATNKPLYGKLSYDPIKDFLPR